MEYPIEIVAFELGNIKIVNMKQVAKLVNISPNIIHLTVGDRIQNKGEPDICSIAYSKESLFALFPKTKVIKVGIILAPIEQNYYTHTNKFDSIIISLSQTDEICKKAGRTIEQYVAQTIVTEFLWLQYKAKKPECNYMDLYHNDVRGCIFDFVPNKNDKIYKLREALIDLECKAKLHHANVPERLIKTIELILKRIKRPSFMDTLRMSLENTVFSLIFGGFIGGLITNIISSFLLGGFDSKSDYIVAWVIVFLILLLLVGNYIWRLCYHKPQY